MSVESLLAQIDVLLAAKGLSDRKACLKAREINPAVGVDFIRDMRRRGHPPRSDKLAALAQVLEVSPASLVEVLEGQKKPLEPIHTTQIEVRGDVQAGVWREAIEWPAVEWYAITVPLDVAFAGLRRYGLIVKGDSMDKVFPDGSIVVVINLVDLGRMPQTGEIAVVVQRSKTSNEFEATVKAVQVLESGEIILWPQSTNPDFATPIRIKPGECDHDAGMPDVFIQALVVASYRPKPMVSF
ncbi:LexA family protein [Gluconobacter kondonii]|uniref:LexA family protein n=1 Tax=Gluconobacter kondonii TaxID=941463 RepID=UPI001B8D424E|nr:S24 family peptidase [Gluconobacter kondonii]MBS1054796.1 helix-turn-helix transcriptional regulator [Gluconobacter kondonii]